MYLRINRSGVVLAIGIGMSMVANEARALDPPETRLLTTPAITEGRIAFVYADDLWLADSDGDNPRRLTSHPGLEQNPFFAPDGKPEIISVHKSNPALGNCWSCQ